MGGRAKLASALFFLMVIGQVGFLIIPDSDVEGAFNADSNFTEARDDVEVDWSYTAAENLNDVAISADGEYIVAGSDNNIVNLFDKDSDTPLWSHDMSGTVRSVGISSDGEYIVAGSGTEVYLFDKDSETPLWFYETGVDVYSVAISSNGEYIVVATDSFVIYFFDKYSSTPLWTFDAYRESEIAISANGEYIVVGTADGGNSRVHLFSTSSNTPIWSYTAGGDIRTVAISDDGEYIAAGGNTNMVYLYSKNSGTPLWDYDTGSNVIDVDISADGEYIVAGVGDGNVILFGKDSNTPLWSHDTTDIVESVAISADGEYIVAGSQSEYVYLYEKDSNSPLWSWGSSFVPTVAISADGLDFVATSPICCTRMYKFTNPVPTTCESSQPATAIITTDNGFNNPGGNWQISLTSTDGTEIGYISYDTQHSGWGSGGWTTGSIRNGQVVFFVERGGDNTPRHERTAEEFLLAINSSNGHGDKIIAGETFIGEGGNISITLIQAMPGMSGNIHPFSGGCSGDVDDDGVYDEYDDCPNTAQGFATDENGCSASQRDTDGDGVVDSLDQCPGTSTGIDVDEVGCWWGQFDYDGDGLLNSNDPCPQTIIQACDSANNYYFSTTISPPDSTHAVVTFSPSEDEFVSGVESGIYNMYVWNTTTKQYVYREASGNGFHVLEYTPDGRYLVGGGNNPMRIWDTNNWSDQVKIENPVPSDISTIAFSRDGELLAYGTTSGQLEILSFPLNIFTEDSPRPDQCQQCRDLEIVANLGSEFGQLMDIKFSADGNKLYVLPYESGLIIVNTTTWVVDATITPSVETGTIYAFDISPNGENIAITTYGNKLFIWNGEIDVNWDTSNALITELSRPGEVLSFSSDGKKLAVGGGENLVVFDTEYWVVTDNFSVTAHEVDFSPSGRMLVSSKHSQYKPGEIRLWEGDEDSDGILDYSDLCPSTNIGETVDGVGCSPNQSDSDGDGVYDYQDQCADTFGGATVDSIGCALAQIDSDADGISDATDQCANTPNGEIVGLTGCSTTQIDSDADGVYDASDDCPSTPEGSSVEANGCATSGDDVVDLDSDSDGVRDSADECANSAAGIVVNSVGCQTSGDMAQSSSTEPSDDFFMLIGGLVCLATLSVPLIFKRVTGSNEELEELRKYKKKVETEFLGGEGFDDSQDFNKDFKKGDFNK